MRRPMVKKKQYPIILEWRIVACPSCHLLQTVRTDRKTRTCVKCGRSFKLDFMKLIVFFKSRDIRDVQYILPKLKIKQKEKTLITI